MSMCLYLWCVLVCNFYYNIKYKKIKNKKISTFREYYKCTIDLSIFSLILGDVLLFKDLDEQPVRKHLNDALYTTDDGNDG